METKAIRNYKIKLKNFREVDLDSITDLEEFEGFEFGDGFNAFDEEFLERYSSQN